MKNSVFKLQNYFKVFPEHKTLKVELFQKMTDQIYDKYLISFYFCIKRMKYS